MHTLQRGVDSWASVELAGMMLVMSRSWIFLATIALILLIGANDARGQAEVYAWGGLRGIRVDGELMAFTTGVRAVPPDSTPIGQSRQERLERPRFLRDGDKVTCTGSILSPRGGEPGGGFFSRGRDSGLASRVVLHDVGPGTVRVDLQVTANAETALTGIYFYVRLPRTDYSGGSVQLIEGNLPSAAPVPLAVTQELSDDQYLSGAVKAVLFKSLRRQLKIECEFSVDVVVQAGPDQDDGDIVACLAISKGNLSAGQTVQWSCTLKASGDVDKSPVQLAVDTTKPGSPFDGIGGNFRLQKPVEDPPIIQYNLDNLRVSWARVRMGLDRWQPEEDEDPVQAAREGRLDEGVRQEMEMARTLAQMNIPTIISVWSAPRWALRTGDGGPRRGFRGQIDPDKWDTLCHAIGSYLQYMKDNYDAEPTLFSFNESDIGIYVLQSPEEHAETIKRLGVHFASRGLATKMLLGDTGNPTGTKFIKPAMEDPEAMKYVGAVSYHSWHHGTDEQLTLWGDVAKRLTLPLFSAEGGTDPDAWRYPAIFEEPWFSLDEINLYTRICRLSQPRSILHWQLTADYSVLAGGGDQPLRPTQRFWNLKQLGSTPAGARAMPITCDRPGMTCAAFCDIANSVFVVHIVNNAAARSTRLTGLPTEVRELRVYVTDGTRGMKEGDRVYVTDGAANFTLDAASFTTLMSGL